MSSASVRKIREKLGNCRLASSHPGVEGQIWYYGWEVPRMLLFGLT